MAASSTAETASATSSIDSSALPSTIASLPDCAIDCLSKSGKEVGCAGTDLECMCSKNDAFADHFDPCLGDECTIKIFKSLYGVRDQVCAAVNGSSDSAALASASAMIASDVPEETGSGAKRLRHTGILGAIAWGALIM
ncbi:cfem domain protein [Fusarium beomiforme]|uniref:Cfem domain protein n=1 Tax=Fusarium beomiforme TaxID=44412 RepID=A0A9P5AFU4_9HYPO|nr:cfem domain protein [Fusarium beomiforme]